VRVLHLVPDLFDAPGGIARHSRLVIKALTDEPSLEQLTVLSLMDHPETPLDMRYIGESYVAYRAFGGNRSRYSRAALREMAFGHYDLLVAGHVNLSPLMTAGTALRRSASRTITFVHGTDVWARLPWYRRQCLALSDLIVAVSHLTANRAIQVQRLRPGRVATLHSCLDPILFPSVHASEYSRDEAAFSRSTPTSRNAFVTVARMSSIERGKGHSTVIRALPRVLARVPDAEYLVVGDGDLRDELQSLAREIGVADRVRFLGRVADADLDVIYQQCKVFVMPSRTEGFGLVFLEAMAHDLPIVAGNTDASPEVIGDSGLLVDPDDADQVGAAITRLLLEPELRSRLVRQARYRLETCFSYEVFRTRLMGYVSELLPACQRRTALWAS
jgi:phosphatidyl-myo-inositol dimannoside synthase